MQHRPLPLSVLAGVALLEGAAFLGIAVATAVSAAVSGISGPSEVASAQGVILEVVIFGALGAAFIAAARGWLAARRWARSIHVLGQLLILVVAIPSLGAVESVQRVLAVVGTVLAAGSLALALTPSVTRAILEQDEDGLTD